MSDFQIIEKTISRHPVIVAPRRANRPDFTTDTVPFCPFCSGREAEDGELYRIDEKGKSAAFHEPTTDWLVRVIPNKFPFTHFHELVIHSPDHHKNFAELPTSHIKLVLQTYRARYNYHRNDGQVLLFHNRGQLAGESVPHAHTQLAVMPFSIPLDIPQLAPEYSEERLETSQFYLFCPPASPWPDEVWIVPQKSGKYFGDISDEEIKNLAFVLPQLLRIQDMRHGEEFPFNLYISPGENWYLRIIPRSKILGGFEVATGIFVNTQDRVETFAFLKKHIAA